VSAPECVINIIDRAWINAKESIQREEDIAIFDTINCYLEKEKEIEKNILKLRSEVINPILILDL